MNEQTRLINGIPRREYMIEYLRNYRDKKKELLKRKRDLKRKSRPEHFKKILKRYYEKNFDKIAVKQKEYREKNKKKLADYQGAYRLKTAEKRKRYMAEYSKNNKDSLREKSRVRLNNRLKTDMLFKLIHYMRSRVREALKSKGVQRAEKTRQLLGCDGVFFRDYLQSKFTPEMNWENYGTYWAVDHVIPISSFDLSKPDERKKAFHYSNCQPLKWEDNHAKMDSMPGPHQPTLI